MNVKGFEPVAWEYEVNNAWHCYSTSCPPDDAYDEGSLKPLYPADQLAAVVRQLDELLSAAQAVVDRWDAPLWQDTPSTAQVINALRAAISKVQP